MSIESGPKSQKEMFQKDRREILQEKGTTSFDVGLTPEEKRGISEILIEKELFQFDDYGSEKKELVKKLIAYLSELGENSEEIVAAISKLVARVAEIMKKDFDKESAWVMVRISLPNNDFNVPRWHTDGKYFTSLDVKDKTYKLIMTIKGPPTRFGEKIDPEKFRELTEEISRNYELSNSDVEAFEERDIQIRKELDRTVREVDPPKEGEAVYYLVGDENIGIHSEPKIDSPRIFMSVVVGSNDQVNELRERWNKK